MQTHPSEQSCQHLSRLAEQNSLIRFYDKLRWGPLRKLRAKFVPACLAGVCVGVCAIH